MKQDYNKAMDQLHLPPQAEQRILKAWRLRHSSRKSEIGGWGLRWPPRRCS